MPKDQVLVMADRPMSNAKTILQKMGAGSTLS